MSLQKTINQKHAGQRGFLLMTAMLVLAILTIVAATAWYKTNIQLQASVTSLESGQALFAAKAGLEHNYAYWSHDEAGQAELMSIINDVLSDTSNTAVYIDQLTPSSMESLQTLAEDVFAKSDVDDLITTSSAIRVYDLTTSGMNVVTNAEWGQSELPQVAVWFTSFSTQDDYTYPYTSPNTDACINCGVVTYALGRFGSGRSLLREFQASAVAAVLDSVSAVTNAPAYRNWQDMCDGVRTGTGDSFAGRTSDNKAVSWRAGEIHNGDDILLEVTQAEYETGVTPSGTALQSNTHLGGEGKNFRKATSSTTIASFDSVPMIAYSGHGPNSADNAVRTDEATRNMDMSTPAINLPETPYKLPKYMIKEPLLGTADEVKLFSENDPNAQLFDLDVYRWGAEQFTYQGAGNAGNGKYSSKAEALRIAIGGNAPVTGRLNLAEFEYNVANGTPMFGLVRVMYPVYDQGVLGTCAAFGGQDLHIYDTNLPTNELTDSGIYDGSAVALDSDGELGANAKMIVYGSVFFDFFTDLDGDGFFDPGDGERLVQPFEATEAKMQMEVSEYINPALPEISSPVAFPSGAGGVIATGSSSAPVNLASPTSGWFPLSEARIPVSSDPSQGQMQIVNTLAEVGRQMMPGSDGGDDKSLATSDAPSIYNTYKTRLDYYYRFMRATAKQSDANAWPISPAVLPVGVTSDICIGVADCVVGNNEGDSLHTLFPSGYHHGWKVALAALDVKASEWNTIFSNLDTLATSADDGTSGYNYGSAVRPKGSAFNTSESGMAAASDIGFTRAKNASDLKSKQSDFFYVTPHASGYGLLDADFKDIPAQIYVGGLIDIHKYNNVSGLVYTPGPLEWETGHFAGATGYFNGAVITGFGLFVESAGITKVILVYDNQASDNIATGGTMVSLRRFAWQELK